MKKSFALFFLNLLISLALWAQPPAGYYNAANGLTGTQLQQALHNIIDNHTVVSYTPGVWNAFYTTDVRSDGKVWDMYSDIPGGTPPYEYTLGSGQCGSASEEGDCYSREHSFPKSWFNDQPPMNTDLFHIYPVDQYVNNRHNNFPYGEVNNPTWTSLNGSKFGPCSVSGYSGSVFEPIDEYKGDFARTYFYMAVRYYGEDAGWLGSPMVNGSQLKPWALTMMLQWAQQDPVSAKEIARNNAVYAIQNNRNPFIDHPEYADAIWGNGSGVKPEPTNYPSGFTTHNIRLHWTDAVGIVLPDGYLIRMSATGYNNIVDPVDGTAVVNNLTNQNVAYGIQEAVFGNLNPNSTYYFKIYSYVFTDAGIDYKTDGVIPQTKQTTQP